jgi:hypothetical protein
VWRTKFKHWYTGSWFDLRSPEAFASYQKRAWPGTAVLIDTDDEQPRLIEILADLNPLNGGPGITPTRSLDPQGQTAAGATRSYNSGQEAGLAALTVARWTPREQTSTARGNVDVALQHSAESEPLSATPLLRGSSSRARERGSTAAPDEREVPAGAGWTPLVAPLLY